MIDGCERRNRKKTRDLLMLSEVCCRQQCVSDIFLFSSSLKPFAKYSAPSCFYLLFITQLSSIECSGRTDTTTLLDNDKSLSNNEELDETKARHRSPISILYQHAIQSVFAVFTSSTTTTRLRNSPMAKISSPT